MAKITLSPLASLTNQTSAISTINSNMDAIEAALENTFSRDGTTPNQLTTDLDLNSNDLLNAGNIGAVNVVISGTTSLQDVTVGNDIDVAGDVRVVGSLTTDAIILTSGILNTLVGPQGPSGPQGPIGPQGAAGAAGEVGPQGIQGETGLTGPKGDKGDTGPQGIQGIQGIQGVQGDIGPIGPTGPQGPAGANGTNGTNGTNGVGVPVGGTTGQVLSKVDATDYNTAWVDAATGSGDMAKAVYDPTNKNSDAFARANHSGTQTAATISDFDVEVSNNTDVAANTTARHTHTNIAILDATTASFTTADETKVDALNTMSTQAATAVAITGGSITGITDLAIADGGTGASTAAAAFTNLKQAATAVATGVVELATDAEVRSQASTTLVVTPSSLAARAAFSAHKNGVAQGAVVSATLTKVTFGTEDFDIGGYYDVATSRWTPPIGTYALHSHIRFSANVVADAEYGIAIYKNGVVFKQMYQRAPAASSQSIVYSIVVAANGTDYFECYAYGGGTGDKTIDGSVSSTTFSGHAV